MSRYKDPALNTPQEINDIRTLPARFKHRIKNEPGKVVLYALGTGAVAFGLSKAFKFDAYYGRGASIGFAVVGLTFGLLISSMGGNKTQSTQNNDTTKEKENKV